ncbi:uncharacterized protein LDX57_007046 [Aspergillus melleus]|uniref:uncharacterized protein n=1 Tax=Aspergillus melleus TaxID=138277 RepID=UPI001E8DA274|nr:uncharacterized protein LDX57_007046 [Aspergillus melleus]KAH8429382.1 hypothetical protein LDX57_007046 [Aspergillus melleus]
METTGERGPGVTQANEGDQENLDRQRQTLELCDRIVQDIDVMRETYSDAEINAIVSRFRRAIDNGLGNENRQEDEDSQGSEDGQEDEDEDEDYDEDEDPEDPEDSWNPFRATMPITHSITETNEVILENVTPGDRLSVINYLSQFNVVHSFLEFHDDPNKLIIRWLMIRKREYYFIDGLTMARFLRAMDEEDESWFNRRLDQYAIDVRDRVGPDRELDYEAGRVIYGMLHWSIMDAAQRWEVNRDYREIFTSNLRWLPAMRVVVDTMADRYREEDPFMGSELGRFHADFLFLLKQRFLANLSVPNPQSQLVSTLTRQEHLHILASMNAHFVRR